MKKLMKKKRKLIIFISIIVSVLTIATLALTYAYFSANISGNTSTSTSVVAKGTASISFSNDHGISLTADQDSFASGSGSLQQYNNIIVNFTDPDENSNIVLYYNVFLNIKKNDFVYTQDESTPELLFEFHGRGDEVNSEGMVTSIDGLTYKENVTDANGNVYSGFDVTKKTGVIPISMNNAMSLKGVKFDFLGGRLTFVNYNADQTDNAGKTFEAELIVTAEPFIAGMKMNEALKLLSVGGELKSNSYVSLPESGLWSHSTTSLDTSAQDGSYRYYGNPDNFVCFGYDVTSTNKCPHENLYRIIGIIDNKVKLIKYDYATKELLGYTGTEKGGYLSSSSITSSSFPKYESKGGKLDSIDYYTLSTSVSQSYNNYAASELNLVNLNDVYLKNLGQKWADKIAMSTWHFGAYDNSNNITSGKPKDILDTEMATSSTYPDIESKVGLMYASDFAYSAMYNWWGGSAVTGSSSWASMYWMFMGLPELTISPNSMALFTITKDGGISFSPSGAIRPVFSLNEDVEYVSGSGTIDSPFIIN